MHKIYIIICMLCIIPVAEGQESLDHTINWSKNYKLKFSDFRIEEDDLSADSAFLNIVDSNIEGFNQITSKSTIAVNIVAYCFIIGDSVKYDIYAKFDPHRSFMQKRDTVVLNYSQIVFDICELHARKLKQYLTDSLSASADQEIIDIIISGYNSEELKMHSGFGRDHFNKGLNKAPIVNAAWRKKIDIELKKYSRYERSEGAFKMH